MLEKREMQTPPLALIKAVPLAPGLRVICAPNPGPMAGPGTNTYLLGWRDIVVIDPGPDDQRHLAAILGAIGPQQRVTHIIVTHAHRDHSALAPALSARTNAPVLAFGDALAGRSKIMADLSRDATLGGGEGVDAGFRPDACLPDGTEITADDWKLAALWTPGHMGNHISLHWNDAVFTGDLVMGWSSSLISPPDGDMAAFYRSCARLDALGARVLYPGHGDPVSAPAARINALLAHRRAREATIMATLSEGASTLEDLTRRVYGDLAQGLFAAARRNAFAHLVDLVTRGQVIAVPDLSTSSHFQSAGTTPKNPR
jgi:glyoxylase-like metal-dependent hydrolase (beta-lactamase superfamily II)